MRAAICSRKSRGKWDGSLRGNASYFLDYRDEKGDEENACRKARGARQDCGEVSLFKIEKIRDIMTLRVIRSKSCKNGIVYRGLLTQVGTNV